jgi:eukaryotic-like serine/threonine-protein kinase
MNPTENRQGGLSASAASSPIGPSAALEDPRIISAMEEYQAALDTGNQPDRQEFLDRHPDLAPILAECLEGLAFVHQLAPRLQQPGESDAGVALFGAEDIRPEGPLGDFRVVREIGRGGMGVVYEAVQISLGRRVALKVLPFAAAMDSKQLQRFKNEAQAAAHLQHTNIVPVHYVGCERGVHFYAMQYIEGQTLAAVIRDLRQLAGPEGPAGEAPGGPGANLASELASGRWAPSKQRSGEVVRSCGSEPPTGAYPTTPPPHHHNTSPPVDVTPPVAALSTERSGKSAGVFRTAAHLGVQAAEAMEHAHQLGVIHRDIKPANLLVDAGGRLWVTDFGLAHCQSQPGLTMSGDLLGTLRYMSPEQALAKRVTVDARTDVYSLGVTLYELLVLEPAYDGRDREEVLRQIAFEEPRLPSRLNNAVPAELETIVLKAMAKNPDERYATAQELADDLRRFLEDKPIKAKRPSLQQRAAKWARRHKTVVRTAFVVMVLAMVALAVSSYLIWLQAEKTKLQAEQTKAAKVRAEANLDIAYEVLEKIYLNLAEKRLPQQKALTPGDRETLENALRFYEQLAQQQGTELRVRRQTALAYLRVATIQSQLGQDAEAKGRYRQALEAFRGLATEFPNDFDHRRNLARCLSDMADTAVHPLYFETREENEAALREAIKLQDSLVAAFPKRADYQHDLAEGYSRLAWHFGEIGRGDESEKTYRPALAIRAKLVEDDPTNLAYRQDLCDILGRLGAVYAGGPHPRALPVQRDLEAEQFFLQSLHDREKLVKDFPGLPSARLLLGYGYRDLARLQQRTRRQKEAEENLRQALVIMAKLVAEFPGVPLYRDDLAGSHYELALTLEQIGRLQEAEQSVQDSLAICERLARDYPTADYAIAVVIKQIHIGDLRWFRGQPEAALASYDQAIATLRKRPPKEPKPVGARSSMPQVFGVPATEFFDPRWVGGLANRTWLDTALGARAVVLVGLGRSKEAEQTFKELHEFLLLKFDPSNVYYWFKDAPLRLHFGNVEGYRLDCREMLARFGQTSDPQIAEQTAKTCLLAPDAVSDLGPVVQLAERAVTQDPQSAWFQLARAAADYRTGHFAQAIERLNRTLSLDRENEPSIDHWGKQNLCIAPTAHLFLAMAHHHLGHAREARQAVQEATKGQILDLRWHSWLRLQIIRSEAERLVNGKAEAPQ